MSGGGEILSSMLGQPKWVVNVSVEGGRHNRNLAEEADIMHLASRDGTLLAYDIRRPFPLADPVGAIIGGGSGVLAAKGGDNRSISVSGLPSTYKLTKGDKLSILYSSTKRFLCTVEETVTASGGTTGLFEVWPFLPAAIAVSNVVTVSKPCGKFKLQANSFRSSGGAGDITAGFTFSLISVP